MQRRAGSLIIGIAVLLVGAPPASAEPLEIQFGSYFFSPSDTTADLEPDAVTFTWVRNDPGIEYHSITSTEGFFSSAIGGPIETYDLRASAGSFPYYCYIHGATSMSGVVRVRPSVDDIRDDRFDVDWAGSVGTFFDVRYREAGKKWKPWFEKWGAYGSTFGRRDFPVDVKPNKTYEIQSRARESGEKSGWSPSLEVHPGDL